MLDLFGVNVGGTSEVSPDGRYRYRLGRRWDAGPAVLFVMLNPSVANADDDDPTIRRIVGFAKRERFPALEVVNLFALVSTDPSALVDNRHALGPKNDAAIRAAVKETAGPIIAAWGAHRMARERAVTVLRLLPEARGVFALRVTADGWPEHPLRLPASAPLVRYRCEHPASAHPRGGCGVPECGCRGAGRHCGAKGTNHVA